MPLSFLKEFLDFAVAEEKRKQEAEDKKQLTKLWFAHFIVKKIARETPMTYEEFMSQSLKAPETKSPAAKPSYCQKKTAEEIMAEFMPIIERDSREE